MPDELKIFSPQTQAAQTPKKQAQAAQTPKKALMQALPFGLGSWHYALSRAHGVTAMIWTNVGMVLAACAGIGARDEGETFVFTVKLRGGEPVEGAIVYFDRNGDGQVSNVERQLQRASGDEYITDHNGEVQVDVKYANRQAIVVLGDASYSTTARAPTDRSNTPSTSNNPAPQPTQRVQEAPSDVTRPETQIESTESVDSSLFIIAFPTIFLASVGLGNSLAGGGTATAPNNQAPTAPTAPADDHGPVFTAPASGGAVRSFAENTAGGTLLYTARARDADGDSVTYSIDSSSQTLFVIDSNSGAIRLRSNARFDFDNAESHDITITARSTSPIQGSVQKSATRTLTINVNNGTDTNTITLTIAQDTNSITTPNFVAGEEISAGAIYQVTGTATDSVTGDSHTSDIVWSFTDTSDSTTFTFDSATRTVRLANDLTPVADGTYGFTIMATVGTSSETHTFTFTVQTGDATDDHGPVFTAPPSGGAVRSFSENTASGTLLYTARAQDADGDSVTYSIDNSSQDLFVIDSNSGAIRLRSDRRLDFEDDASHQITITARSTSPIQGSAQKSATRTLTINVADGDDITLTIAQDTNTVTTPNFMIGAEISAGAVYQVTGTATDSVTGDSHTSDIVWSFTDTSDSTIFTFNGATRTVLLANDLTPVADGTYSFTIMATVGASSETHSFTFTVQAPEATDDHGPVFIAPASGGAAQSFAENTAGGTLLYTARAQDADGDSVTYSIDSSSQDLFVIDSNSGAIRLKNDTELDFEAAESHEISITAMSTSPIQNSATKLATEMLTINVTDIDDLTINISTESGFSVPTFTDGMTIAANTTVYDVTATAIDSANGANHASRIVWSLEDDHSGLFAIDSNDGVVTITRDENSAEGNNYDLVIEATIGVTRKTFNRPIALSSTSAQNTDPEFIDIGPFSLPEGTISHGVGVVTARDTDPNDSIDSYTILSATMHHANGTTSNTFLNFIIQDGGAIRYTGPELDADGPSRPTHAIVSVQIEDTTGNQATQDVRVNILDLNDEAPEFETTIPSDITYFRHQQVAAGTSVYNAIATPDLPIQVITWEISGMIGTENADDIFSVVDGAITFTNNWTPTSTGTFTFDIVASVGALSDSQSIEFTVEEPPNLAPPTIDFPGGSTVGGQVLEGDGPAAIATHADQNVEFNFSATDPEGAIIQASDFTITALSGFNGIDPNQFFEVIARDDGFVLQLKQGQSLDYDAGTRQYVIGLTVSDGLHTSQPYTFRIIVADDDDIDITIAQDMSFERPPFIDTETITAGTELFRPTVMATDDPADPNKNTLLATWSLKPNVGDVDLFDIDAITGVISLKNDFFADRDLQNSYTVVIVATIGLSSQEYNVVFPVFEKEIEQGGLAISNQGTRASVVVNGVEFRALLSGEEPLSTILGAGQAYLRIVENENTPNLVRVFDNNNRITVYLDPNTPVHNRQQHVVDFFNNSPVINQLMIASIAEPLTNDDFHDDPGDWYVTPSLMLGVRDTSLGNTRYTITGGASLPDLNVTKGSDVQASGYLTIIDADGYVIHGVASDTGATVAGGNLSPTRTVTYQGTYGTLVIDHDGDWVYTLSNNAAVQALDDNDIVFDTFIMTLIDLGPTALHSDDVTGQTRLRIIVNGSESASSVTDTQGFTVINQGARAFAVVNGVEFRALHTGAAPLSSLFGEDSNNHLRILGQPYDALYNEAQLANNQFWLTLNNDPASANRAAENTQQWIVDLFNNMENIAELRERMMASIRIVHANDSQHDESSDWYKDPAGSATSSNTSYDVEGGRDWVDRVVTAGVDSDDARDARGYLRVANAQGDVTYGAVTDFGATIVGTGTARVVTYQGQYGTLVLDHDGDWIYTLSNNFFAQALENNEIGLDSFAITLTDTGQNPGSSDDTIGNTKISITVKGSETVAESEVIRSNGLEFSNEGARASVVVNGVEFQVTVSSDEPFEPGPIYLKIIARDNIATGVNFVNFFQNQFNIFLNNDNQTPNRAAENRQQFVADLFNNSEVTDQIVATILNPYTDENLHDETSDWYRNTNEPDDRSNQNTRYRLSSGTDEVDLTVTKGTDNLARGHLVVSNAVGDVIFGDGSNDGAINTNITPIITGTGLGRVVTYGGVYGTLVIDYDGDWIYRLNNNSRVQALADTEIAFDTFIISVTDSSVSPDPADDIVGHTIITVTVNGSGTVPNVDSNGLIVDNLGARAVAFNNGVEFRATASGGEPLFPIVGSANNGHFLVFHRGLYNHDDPNAENLSPPNSVRAIFTYTGLDIYLNHQPDNDPLFPNRAAENTQQHIVNLVNDAPVVDGWIKATIRDVLTDPERHNDFEDWRTSTHQFGEEVYALEGGTNEVDLVVTRGVDTDARGYLEVANAVGDVIYGAETDDGATVMGGEDLASTRVVTYEGVFGTLVIDHDGDWVYELSNNNAVLNIGARRVHNDTFTITVTDEGATSAPDDDVIGQTQIVITVHGSPKLQGYFPEQKNDLNGTTADDIIQGGNKADSIISGGGRDLIMGGYGDDTIALRAEGQPAFNGDQTVVYRFSSRQDGLRADDGGDVIHGFDRGVDKLLLIDTDDTPITLQDLIDGSLLTVKPILEGAQLDLSDSSPTEDTFIVGVQLVFDTPYTEDGPDGGIATSDTVTINWIEEDKVAIYGPSSSGVNREKLVNASLFNLDIETNELTDLSFLPNYFDADEGFADGLQVIPIANHNPEIL